MRRNLWPAITGFLLWGAVFASSASSQQKEPDPPVRNGVWGLDEEGGLAIVYYDLDAPPKGEVEIKLVLHHTGKSHQTIKPKQLVGNVGENVPPGKRRKVVWDYRKESIDGLAGDGWYFDILADWDGDDFVVPTRMGSFNPPRLHIESLKFWGKGNGSLLNAGESADITFMVSNSGKGPARSSRVTVTPLGLCSGISYDQSTLLGMIPPGGVARGKVTLHALEAVPSQPVTFRIEAADSARYDSNAVTLTIETKEEEPARLEIVERSFRPGTQAEPRPIDRNSAVFRGDSADVFLRIKNTGTREADSAYASVSFAADEVDLHFGEGPRTFPLSVRSRAAMAQSHAGNLLPGESATIVFSIFTDRRFVGDSVRILVSISQQHPRNTRTEGIDFGVVMRPPGFEERAARFVGTGSYDSLITLSVKQILLTPDSAAPYYYAGLGYEQKRDLKSCLAYYQKAADRGHVQSARWIKENRIRDVTRVSYRPLNPNPFAAFTGTIGLGILRWNGPGGGASEITTKLYERLKESPDVVRRFALYSMSSLDTLSRTLKLGSLDAGDRQLLKGLDAKLAVRFVVTGTEIDERTLSLKVIRTSDGSVVIDKECKSSETSTALGDAVLLFQSGKMPAYRLEPVVESRRR